jgi:hypothetical protein
MPAMVRKQVYIDPVQDRLLKRRARELGVTEAEIIRRAIDQFARTPLMPPFDPEALNAVLSSMEARDAVETSGKSRTWRREDLYEDRVGSLSG